jgi:hypothetical protein
MLQWEAQQVDVVLSRAIDCLQRFIYFLQHRKPILAQHMPVTVATAACRKYAGLPVVMIII